jgi:class 3 adenylate cyclase
MATTTRLTDPRLSAVIEAIEATGWAAELCDPEWRLLWCSSELLAIVGADDGDGVELGAHAVAVRGEPPLQGKLTLESGLGWLRLNLPLMAHGTRGGLPAMRAMLSPDVEAALGPVEEAAPRMLWTGEVEFIQANLPPAPARYVTTCLHTSDGERLGWLTVYGPGARAAIAALVIRGDQAMFGRMAELLEPARRATAVLFADIQASSRLARHISTAGYFELIRGFTTAVDEIVIRHSGIVGRHAGDGVTAFFLADQVGGTAAACAAALGAGCEIVRWRPQDKRLDYEEFVVNAGAHWGGALYLGQIVTGGRLEITALGDEVNECARIQQSARNGSLLASKSLIERLDLDAATALGFDPMTLSYHTVGELPGVTHKAVRDAGGVPVVHVPWAQ